MKLELTEHSPASLQDYSTIPIAFDVTERFEIEPRSDGTPTLALHPRKVEPAYVKDYDLLPGQRPADWPQHWDLGKWWFASAFQDGRRVGGVTVVTDTTEIDRAAARPDEAILWDIRISPICRRHGIGQRLIDFAETHARTHSKRHMKVETQNINVPACRFYAKAGYTLSTINPFAYAAFPNEIQLIWRKELIPRSRH